jgi:isopropylmalate/homocitrate/citramalate synthase
MQPNTNEAWDMDSTCSVNIVDTTIREGQQHGYVSFSTEQAVRLARLLDSFGVEILEVGHPAVSEQDKKTARALCQIGLSAGTLAHARAMTFDVTAAVDVGASWVGIVAGVNEAAVCHKMHRPRTDILERVKEAVYEAKRHGLGVRFTCEDASRTAMPMVVEAFEHARQAGADRLSYADTVGVLTPSVMRRAVETLVERFGPVIHVHCHNDFGLATANTLAAYEAGAIGLDVSIDGIGERCGIASLAEVTCGLRQLHKTHGRWDLSLLPAMSRELATVVERTRMDTKPIVGKYAFSHKAGMHLAAQLEERIAYEPLDPAIVGRRGRYIVSRLVGLRSLNAIMRLLGVELDNKTACQLLSSFKQLDETMQVSAPGTNETM